MAVGMLGIIIIVGGLGTTLAIRARSKGRGTRPKLGTRAVVSNFGFGAQAASPVVVVPPAAMKTCPDCSKEVLLAPRCSACGCAFVFADAAARSA